MMKHAIKSALAGAALALAAFSTATTIPTAAQAEIGAVRHSPWLALRIQQSGEFVPLRYKGEKRTEVTLKKQPFTLIFPVSDDNNTYQVTAWDEDSIFAQATGAMRVFRPDRPGNEPPAYFGPATGMADTAASQGDLFLNDEAHHYLTGLRLGPEKDRPIFHVSSVSKWTEDRERIQTAIKDIKHPLYLVVWYDENGDDKMSHSEYEFLVLRFK